MSITLDSIYKVTDENRDQYRDDGYFITDVLFNAATLDGVQSEFQRIWKEDIANAERSGNAKQVEQAKLRAFSSKLEERSKICNAFCHHPQLASISAQLLGENIDMTWNQCIAKPPSKGKAFAWHQDLYYALHGKFAENVVSRERMLDPRSCVTFWIAITRTTIENGTMWVVPGTHKTLHPHIYSDENLEWQCQFDSSKKLPAELKRGQALVFTGLTPHCSGDNISDEVRMAYQIGYGVPGLLRNNYQVPILRKGEPV